MATQEAGTHAPPGVDPATGEITEPEDDDTTTEPEDDDDPEGHAEPEGETDPEPDTALSPVASQKEMERAFGKLEAEAKRHAARVSEIMGEDATALVVCELCRPDIPGFRFAVEPTEDVKRAVRAAIGLPTLESLKPDTFSRVCDLCEGAGKVASGSRVQGQETLSCHACKGKGWLPVGAERQFGAVSTTTPGEAPALVAVGDDGVERDMFGTPVGDPDYGRMPQYRDRPTEYWQQSQGQGST